MNPTHTRADGAVVVAIDESAWSFPALTWAANYARNTDVSLHVVHVLRYDLGGPLAWTPDLRVTPRTISEPETSLIETTLQDLYNSIPPEPSWTLSFLNGAVGPTIVEFAERAQLLVVGTREHRGLERLLVGSVSHYCLSHAACPVLAVPPTPVGAAPARSPNGATGLSNGSFS